MTIQLTGEDSGTTRTVHVGERVALRLPENPTTGYRWQVDFDDTRLRLAEDRFEGPQSPRGAGGERALIFDVLVAGSTTLRLANRRSWGDGDPTAEFVVELAAQPAG